MRSLDWYNRIELLRFVIVFIVLVALAIFFGDRTFEGVLD